MNKDTVDAFVHHIAEAQRTLTARADELCREVDEESPRLRHGTFDREQAQEWNQIREVSDELLESRDKIVELTPADAPLI